MTIIFGQCNDATRTEIALGANYNTDCENRELINFLARLQTVYYGSDDGGLSFKPYKNVVVVKSLNNFSNAKSNDPYGFKEELKIKFDAVLAVVGKFLNSTRLMLESLKAEVPVLDWAAYCAMDVADQGTWEERGDAFTKVMLLLRNSKNDNAKKDLHLSYSQGNKSAFQISTEAMVIYLSTQYNNKIPNNPHNKRGDRNSKKGDDSKSEDKDSTTTGTAGVHLGEVTTSQDSTIPSEGSSIGTYISEIAEPAFHPAQSAEELLAAHPVDDAIWSHTNPSDVSIDTTNSAEIIVGIHSTEVSTYIFHRSDLYGLLKATSHVSHKDNVSWYDRSAFLDIFDDSNESANTDGDDDVTKDSTNESIKSNFWIGERQS